MDLKSHVLTDVGEELCAEGDVLVTRVKLSQRHFA